jgi:hypothetical protein
MCRNFAASGIKAFPRRGGMNWLAATISSFHRSYRLRSASRVAICVCRSRKLGRPNAWKIHLTRLDRVLPKTANVIRLPPVGMRHELLSSITTMCARRTQLEPWGIGSHALRFQQERKPIAKRVHHSRSCQRYLNSEELNIPAAAPRPTALPGTERLGMPGLWRSDSKSTNCRKRAYRQECPIDDTVGIRTCSRINCRHVFRTLKAIFL